MDRREHWQGVYEGKDPTEVSWFQPRPESSLALIDRLGLGPDARVIDVGGGASRLVDALLERGFRHLTVLDISEKALAHSRSRLGERAGEVRWIEADVTAADLPGPFDLWHDRAVFHFLTDAEDRAAYVQRLVNAVPTGGHAVIATFAEDGPERCSGLPVVRYTAEGLDAELGPAFALRDTFRELHETPAGKEQSFVYCRFERT